MSDAGRKGGRVFPQSSSGDTANATFRADVRRLKADG